MRVVAPDRNLLWEGEVIVRQELMRFPDVAAPRPLQVLLFNDVIIFAKTKMVPTEVPSAGGGTHHHHHHHHKGRKGKHHNKKGGDQGKEGDKSSKIEETLAKRLHFQFQLDTARCHVEDLASSSGGGGCEEVRSFKLVHPSKVLTLTLPNAEEKVRWMDLYAKAIRDQQAKAKHRSGIGGEGEKTP